jgi:hypothetical protein
LSIGDATRHGKKWEAMVSVNAPSRSRARDAVAGIAGRIGPVIGGRQPF